MLHELLFDYGSKPAKHVLLFDYGLNLKLMELLCGTNCCLTTA